jgi:hypothetical protein
MIRLLRGNAIAIVALFIALTGSAYAGSKLAANSVGSKQIVDNSVASVDVKDGTLTKSDIAPGVSLKGDQGPAGPAGPKGDKGDKGDPATRLFARINASGGVVAGSGVVQVKNAGTGFWNIKWDRPVTNCAVIVTPDSATFADASPYSSPNDETLVKTYDINTKYGKAVPFNVAVFC